MQTKSQKQKQKLSPRFNPEQLTVDKRKGDTVTASNERLTITRNVPHFKVINSEWDHSSDEEQPTGNYGKNRQQTPVNDVTLRRRSVRQQQPVSRFGNPIPSELIAWNSDTHSL